MGLGRGGMIIIPNIGAGTLMLGWIVKMLERRVAYKSLVASASSRRAVGVPELLGMVIGKPSLTTTNDPKW